MVCRTYLGKYEEENDDVLVNCMRAAGDSGSCQWPRKKNECWVSIEYILSGVPVPNWPSLLF